MLEENFDVALIDNRPFFETVLQYGIKQSIIDSVKITAIENDAPKGMVQIAEAFGSKYLRPEIEAARKRIVNLVSLYLFETSKGDLVVAAKLIRDNTFLSLSRGGSGLLKALFSMPEYALLGREEKGRVEDFLEFWSLKENPLDYHKALKQRQVNAEEIGAGLWFGACLGWSASLLQEEDAEASAVVRSAMLVQLIGKPELSILNQIEFATILASLRAKDMAGKIAKTSKKKFDLLSEEVPSAFYTIAERVRQEIIVQDLPRVQDVTISLDKLVYELKDRYFIRDHEVEDTSDYDALVSKEWTRITKGKTDIDSLLTVFLCLAVGLTPKTSLPEKTAKTLIKKIRSEGFHPEIASEWIKISAPHEKQDGLLEDWRDFSEDANNYLLDDWDTTLSGALRFLGENCHIEKTVKK
ncbi:hypothetical protein BH11PSE12_BH11PSE12_30540 [soil metagenome]